MRVPLALFATLALFVPLLAGCTTPAPPAPPVTQGPGPPAALAFAHDIALPGPGDGEPNIAILPDGTLFVTSPAGTAEKPNAREGSAYLWRSTDRGTTWQVLRSPTVGPPPPSNPVIGSTGAFCSCDADVVTSPDGWVYYVDWWIAGFVGPGNYLVEASSDGGNTWTPNSAPIPENLLASMDREWVVAGPDGFIGLFYSFFGPTPAGSIPVPAEGLDRPSGEIEAIFSTDHGKTWTSPVAVVPASDESYQIAHPRLSPDGTLWMPYGAVQPKKDFWGDPSRIMIATSKDKGKTWNQTQVADVPNGFDNLWAVQGAVDPATGQASIVWASRVDKQTETVSISQSSDLSHWGDPVAVAPSGTNFLPWVAARNGTVTVGWYGSDFKGDPAKAPMGTSWYAMAARWDGTGTMADRFVTSRVSETPVKMGAFCPRGAACGSDRQLLDYVSLDAVADGTVYYAFAATGGSGTTVHVAHTTA